MKDSLISKFVSIKKNDPKYFFNFIVCFSLILGHLFFTIVFSMLNIKILAILSAISASIFILCFFLILYKQLTLAMFLCVFNMMTIIFFQLRHLGWESGFQYYILFILPMIFLPNTISMRTKKLLTAICITFYILIYQSIRWLPPLESISDFIIIKLNDINISIVFISLAFILYHYNSSVNKSELCLNQLNENLKLLSETDQLTGVFNRRHILNEIENEISFFETNQIPFVLALADIDNFKKVNDTFGHDCGDDVLKKIVSNSKTVLRENDIIARWGGEEFLFLLPKTDLKEAFKLMENVRLTISNSPINYNKDNINFNVTVTIGLALYNGTSEIKELIKIADSNLYKGKHLGKNRVVL